MVCFSMQFEYDEVTVGDDMVQVATSVTRKYHFESAHFLPKVREGHKCARMHGHNYEMEVHVSGLVGEDGFIIDFWDLDKVVQPLIDKVDHRTLNNIPGLENPTAENIAEWFLRELRIAGCEVTRVRIYETKECWSDVFVI